MHLPWTLLFLLLPCCFLVRDFTEVKGIMGGSLSMQCPYEEKHRTHGKSWCKGSSLVFCITLLETNGSEGEVKKGRVAIRDNHQNLIFSVTMENLSADDAASYACGIDEPFSFEPLLWFTVSISQETVVKTSKAATWTAEITNTTQGLLDGNLPKDKNSPRRSSLSNVFVVLIFLTSLKLPIFLSLVSMVIWMKRLQRRQRAAGAHHH
ncbi:CMRF35-like molecule 5 isoform X2 [Ornithorhynchus anatinus]|uniref:Immunoglobulin V-set domain-containing protein n=1 Tax=Ornithorhynchus anatinus TaxID=9258 RepID=F7B7Y6_ORNAN|nr:CMRF35-like molecule 5 isoform X2 [Ornithorhynchus anatinus]